MAKWRLAAVILADKALSPGEPVAAVTRFPGMETAL